MGPWLWHPKKKVEIPVEARHYRCCLGCCTSQCGFVTLTVLTTAFYLVFGFVYLLALLVSGPLGWVYMFACLMMLITSLLGIFTHKPVYMQIYWLLSLILNGVNLASSAFFTFVNCRHIWGRFGSDNLPPHFFAYLAAFAIVLVSITWSWSLTYSFYSFVRDKQLYNEQYVPKPMTIHVETQPFIKESDNRAHPSAPPMHMQVQNF